MNVVITGGAGFPGGRLARELVAAGELSVAGAGRRERGRGLPPGREMAAALSRVAGPETASLVDWAPDPGIARIVTSWPARVVSAHAERLGLTTDPDCESVIRAHIAESS
jgi:NAD(P)-dependent dehydrogenase (short-subunit alcohol dehydrogenase family)